MENGIYIHAHLTLGSNTNVGIKPCCIYFKLYEFNRSIRVEFEQKQQNLRHRVKEMLFYELFQCSVMGNTWQQSRTAATNSLMAKGCRELKQIIKVFGGRTEGEHSPMFAPLQRSLKGACVVAATAKLFKTY